MSTPKSPTAKSQQPIANSREPEAMYDPPTTATDPPKPWPAEASSNRRQAMIPYSIKDEDNLIDYLRVIFKYRWMILCITFVAMAATVAWCLRQPRMYQATTSIVPPIDTLSGQGGLASKFGGIGSSLLQGMFSQGNLTELYVGILESRVVSEALVDRFNLVNASDKVTTRANAGSALRRRTSIRASKDGIVRVTVKDCDKKQAAAIANAYVEELDRQNKRLSSAQATSKRVFLENRIGEIQDELRNIDSLQSREVQNKEMLFELLNRECEIAKIEEAKSMPTIQILDQAVAPEKPLRRGTVQKGIVVGIAAMMLGMFIAFSCEHIAKAQVV